MAENENIVLEEKAEVPAESNKVTFKAKLKEWCRKKIVSLKRAPQNIALLVLLATTVYFMLVLFPIGQAVKSAASDPNTPAIGITMFVTTLLSLLVLVSALNSFPKRKKPNIVFIVMVFVMIAVMIVCDIVYYIQMSNCLKGISNPSNSMYKLVSAPQGYVLGHIIMCGISAVVFALIPVYGKLIKKIDTSVKLESATENMSGNIDIQED